MKCVDPSLYGTAPQTTDRFLYPKAFHYAWATGSTNLEKYLEINCRYDEGDAINAIESFIGFPVNPATQAMSNSSEFPALELPLYVYNLNAFKRRDRDRPAEVRVPSFQEWFKILEDEFGLVVPLEEQRSLVLHYSDIPAFREYELFDVVDLYTQITGCTQDGEEWNAPPVRDVGCKDWPFKQTQAAAGVRTVGEGSISSKRCILNFKRSGVPRTAGSIRVLLDVCQDANAFNTGVGLGYNPGPQPLVCKPWREQIVAEKYTGREYILRNNKRLSRHREGRDWVKVSLGPVPSEGSTEPFRWDYREGYPDCLD